MPFMTPIDAAQRAQQLYNDTSQVQSANALRNMQLQAAQRDYANQEAMQNAVRNSVGQNGQIDFSGIRNSLLQNGNIDAALKFDAMANAEKAKQVMRDVLSGQQQAPQQSIGQTDMPQQQMGTAAPMPQSPGRNSTYQKYLQIADKLSGLGMGDAATQYYSLADKFKPELKEQKVLMQNGQRIVVNYYKDGTAEVQPYQPDREKLHFGDTGGQLVGLDPYTGQAVTGIRKTMTPGEMATNARSMEANNAGKWTYDAERGLAINAITGEARPINMQGGPAIGGKEKPLTEVQGNATGFGMRATKANDIIGSLEQQGVTTPSLIKSGAESVPLIGGGLGAIANATVANPAQQKVEQAQRDFVNAILRKESGAAISPSEFENARKQYFAQPGDSAPVIEQKRANRETAIQALRIQAGPGAREIGRTAAPKQTFDAPPDPRQYTGQTIRDPATGQRLQSDGSQWVRVK
jgi:hypothetical protein